MTENERIIYRHVIDRPPTLEDRAAKIGFEGFVEKLQEQGWVARDGRLTTLRNFKCEYEGHAQKDNNYIEWRATAD